MSANFIDVLLHSFRETLSVVMISGAGGVLAGIPLGMWLYIKEQQAAAALRPSLRGVIVHLSLYCVRRTPTIVMLVVAMTALHYFPVGLPTMLATALPLAMLAALSIARKTECAFSAVDPRLTERARSMGANELQIVRKVLLPESRAELISSAGLAISALVGYAALVGAIGGSGLGGLGIRYGYQEFIPEAMLVVVAMLLAMAEAAQYSGWALARRFDR